MDKSLLVVIGLCLPFMLLTIWAVLHAATREFGSMERKALWMLISAVPFIGFIFYVIFGLKQRKSGRHQGQKTD